MTYSWSRIDADATMPKSAVFSDYNRVVTIRDIQLAHSGTYRCRVQRQLGGETHGDLTIVVEGMSFSCSPVSRDALLSIGQSLWHSTDCARLQR